MPPDGAISAGRAPAQPMSGENNMPCCRQDAELDWTGFPAKACAVRQPSARWSRWPPSKGVSLEFVPSREPVARGRKPEGHEPAQQADEKESRREHPLRHAERGVEPGCSGQPCNDGQGPELQERRQGHEFWDVTAFVVAYLMREHRLELLRRELGHERVEKDNAAKAPESREEGIGVP